MTKLLTIRKTVWIAFLMTMVVAFIMAITAHAQGTPQDAAKKYNVTFPIAELGGCTDYATCRTFCEDPLNSTACIDYAKKKGFYHEEKYEVKGSILEIAKRQLGCDSKVACLSFCEIPANFDKCDAFAKGQGLAGGRVDDPSKTQVISRAKEVLGCDSATGCQTLCSKEENRQKCSEFAKTVGLRGGEAHVGPGGCNSEQTCKAFCSDPQNFEVCKGFSQSSGGKFSGPGGCNSEGSCRAYCKDHENECRGMGGPGGSPPPGYSPQEMCSRTPNCKWEKDTCQCGFYGGPDDSKRAGEYAEFCRKNPDKCGPGQAGGFGTEKERKDFEDYCRQNPDRCRPSTGPTTSGSPYPYSSGGNTTACPEPAGGCGSGTTWDRGTCTCKPSSGCPSGTAWNGTYCMTNSGPSGGSSGSSYNYQSPPPGGYSTDPATGCAQAGCNWTGSSCQCSSSSTPPSQTTTSTPAPQPAQTSAPQPEQTSQPQQSTPAPEVHGIFTGRSIFQKILDFFR